MLKRTITGAVILLITALFVGLRYFSEYVFDAYVLILCYGAIFEVIKAKKLSGSPVSSVPLYIAPLLIAPIFMFVQSSIKTFAYLLIVIILVVMYALIEDIIVFAKKRKENVKENPQVQSKTLFENTKNTMMTLAYPILPLSLLFGINHIGYDVGFMGIILVFAVAMLTDTMAYLIGRAFGKRKFVPEVSPNKTIAGMIGGFIGGIMGAAACFCAFYFGNIFGLSAFPLELSISAFMVIGFVGAFLNQLGDLVASAFKRRVGIKDFSNIFPGHGGFMDRVDGLMFTGVLVFAILTIFLV